MGRWRACVAEYDFPVQGIFLDGLERYAIREIGLSAVERIQAKIGRTHTRYSFDTAYADNEVGLIVQGVSEACSISRRSSYQASWTSTDL